MTRRTILILIMGIGALATAHAALWFTGILSVALWTMTAFIVAGIYGNIVRNRMGINTEPVRCPACATPVSPFRKPANLHQLLWGGHTCRACGTEMDKWGDAISGPAARH